MAQQFSIRPANSNDFDALMPLWQQLDTYHQDCDPVRFPKRHLDCPRERAYVEDLIERPDVALLVVEATDVALDKEPQAEPASRLVALCLILIRTYAAGPVFPARVIFEIENLVVEDSMRRRGIARWLLREAEKWSKEHGAGEVMLNVYDFNDGARHFYEQTGFLATRTQMVKPLY